MSDANRIATLIYLTPEERKALEQKAEESSRTISAEGRAAIRYWLSRPSTP